eukprot:c25338_g1_i1.p1 GENE.c25338_g1_i1~~c25338_g1_i1.p1  ORF type:complete len:417 (+),score=93.99 c25338_g1_i1:32-1252(+)
MSYELSAEDVVSGPCAWWTRFWIKHDPDDVFAYDTIKVVRIRDRQLGLLHHFFQFGILLYIVFYVMIVGHGYLKYDQPVGVIRAGIQQCPTGASCTSDLRQLPYCTENNTGIAPLPCRLYDEQEICYPIGQGDPMFVATRITESVQSRVCGAVATSCKGNIWNTTGTTSFYTAGVENWSIQLDHSVQAPSFSHPGDTKYQGDNRDLDGELVFVGSKEVLHFQSGLVDNFPLSTLTRAAGVNLDSLSDSSGDNVPMRYDGIVLLVMIHYTNTYVTFAPAPRLRYTVSAKHIAKTEFKSVHPIANDGTVRTTWNMHGVRIEFVQTGAIGKFDFQTMLVQLVTALALLKVSTVVVDSIALYFKELKGLYRKAKIEETEDFSDVRDALRSGHSTPQTSLLGHTPREGANQ